MQCLINNQLVTQTAFAEINQKVNEHFGQAKGGNASEQSNDEAMGAGMGCQPPFPTQGNVFPRTFLDRHLVALERKITQKVPEDQHDQQINRLVDGNEGGLHT